MNLVRVRDAHLGYISVSQIVDESSFRFRRPNAGIVDVVITDINMPRLDGFGVIEGVRANPEHRATPILVLTTESDAAKKERARSAGATGWIVKPFNPVKLVDAVRRVAA